MPARSTDQYIATVRENVSTEQELVNRLLEDAYAVNNSIALLIEQKHSPELYNRAFLLAVDEVIEKAKNILYNHAERARLGSEEYSKLGMFREQLINAVDEDKIYSYKHIGSIATVGIDLWRSAGRLNEYANAVLAVRATFKANKKGKHLSPESASRFWREKIFGAENMRYYNTMEKRSQHFVNYAPWWNLLDKGNISVKMKSDWGGTAYPINAPTHFVKKAQKEIQQILQNKFNIKLELLRKKYDKQIDKLTKRSQKLVQAANEISTTITNTAVFKSKIGIAEQILKGQVAGYEYDPVRIKELAIKIARGDEVSTRVYLGNNLKRSIRSSINKINGLYEKIDRGH